MANRKIRRRDFLKTSLKAIGLTASSLKSSSTWAHGSGHGAQSGGCLSPSPEPYEQISTMATKERLESHVHDVLIIGSGYGASVMAARLGEFYHGEKKIISVLERGKEWRPGEFPEKALDAASDFFRTPLTPLGLVDRADGAGNSDFEIICASGVGGTSLINAAITIRPELSTLQAPEWPTKLREEGTGIWKYYGRAETMLGATRQSQDKLPKTVAHKAPVEKEGAPFGLLNLNIRPPHWAGTGSRSNLNEEQVPQGPCVNCGNCCSGCNYNAKNTLATNYLARAKKRFGVKIYSHAEVLTVNRNTDGMYVVEVEIHSLNQGWDLLKTDTATLHAGEIILGAGAKGSTEILMRSKARYPGTWNFSSTLGTRLSANGDVMAMRYNTDTNYHSLGLRGDVEDVPENERPGTTIASYGNYRNTAKVEGQFLWLDGTVPAPLTTFMANGLATKFGPSILASQGVDSREKTQQMKRVALDSPLTASDWRRLFFNLEADPNGALSHSAVYYACGHDEAKGQFIYDKESDSFDYTWPDALEDPHVKRIVNFIQNKTERVGGIFVAHPQHEINPNPKLSATHPLGGAPMGDSWETGVVDDRGRVFSGDFNVVYPGFFVVDASVIPRSLAATPLITICALAERMAQKYIDEKRCAQSEK